MRCRRRVFLGLSTALYLRTSVEPVEPIGLDPAVDDLSLFPFLYWPVTADQPLISDEAAKNLNTFLRTGGVVLFDTLDGDSGSRAGASPNTLRLRQIVEDLSIPPLEPVPPDHVLTRSFYLIQDFPGRHRGTAAVGGSRTRRGRTNGRGSVQASQ